MTSIRTGPSRMGLQWLAIPAVIALVAFLGYSSQWLFYTAAAELDPGWLSPRESVVFNALLLGLGWTYFRACSVDPGRYTFETSSGSSEPMPIPSGSSEPTPIPSGSSSEPTPNTTQATKSGPPRAWCRKCNAPKPPRAHHCRHCARCIPKMDHHCPWTGNCVSLQTLPHFLRFLLFANAALATLDWHLARRFAALWAQRHLPAYLGPSPAQLLHLVLLGLVGSAASLALAIMLATTLRAWLFNMTMIESWELDRYEALLDRQRHLAADGTWWEEAAEDDSEDDGGEHSGARPAARLEFPYDLGFFANMAQAMGTANVLLWCWPGAGAPAVSPTGRGIGWDWPENGFNDRLGMWPPPDPDRRRRRRWAAETRRDSEQAEEQRRLPSHNNSPDEEKAAFRARQAADFEMRRRRGRRARESSTEDDDADSNSGDDDSNSGDDDDSNSDASRGMDGKRGWMNADGDRLRDYGVDEEAEAEVDDDDIPLAALKPKLEKRAAASYQRTRKHK